MTVAVPCADELNVTEHFPVVSVVQIEGLSEPIVEEKDTVTPVLLSDVDAMIVDVWAVVMLVGLADNER